MIEIVILIVAPLVGMAFAWYFVKLIWKEDDRNV
tara:strand:- start:1267 stop:1368 length:102 start_codon:yes stop_codon:yes gene_type:complete